MEWYGKTHLNPEYTKKLMDKWQSPPGNTAAHYYRLFPELEPFYLPADHHIVKYDESKYHKRSDYRTFKEPPPKIKSKHFIEWETGFGPCNVCQECITAEEQNNRQMSTYYKKLELWKTHGTPM